MLFEAQKVIRYDNIKLRPQHNNVTGKRVSVSFVIFAVVPQSILGQRTLQTVFTKCQHKSSFNEAGTKIV